MKSQKEIMSRLNHYKSKLSLAMEEKIHYENSIHPDIDIIIFSLVDKIEALLWVLDVELPDYDLWEQISSREH